MVRTVPKKTSRTLPADLAGVALIDAATCAAVGAMSLSWWHEEVRAGRAPFPVIRKPRCTRWRMTDVSAYWRQVSSGADANVSARAIMIDRATKASAQAREPAAVAKAQATRKARIAAREGAAT